MKKTTLCLILTLSGLLAGCKPKTNSVPEASSSFSGPTLSPIQTQLLDLAFDAVSMMPLKPHVRNRSRAQFDVVETCLELNQPEAAARYARQIADWHQALSYAKIAMLYLERGDIPSAWTHMEKTERLVDLAFEARQGRAFAAESNRMLLDSLSEWRLDRVRAHLSNAFFKAGELEKAAVLLEGLGPDERAIALAYRIMNGTQTDPLVLVDEISALFEKENFEAKKYALQGYGELFGRYYANGEARRVIGERIEQHRVQMPLFMQVELLTAMARHACNHGDVEGSINLLKVANEALDSGGLPLRMQYPLKAEVVAQLFKCGSQDQAESELREMMRLYEQKRSEITDIYRSAMVCSIADVCVAAGDHDLAVAYYGKAIEESQANPNSRPRSEDLSGLCRALAVNDLGETQLETELAAKISSLGDPW